MATYVWCGASRRRHVLGGPVQTSRQRTRRHRATIGVSGEGNRSHKGGHRQVARIVVTVFVLLNES